MIAEMNTIDNLNRLTENYFRKSPFIAIQIPDDSHRLAELLDIFRQTDLPDYICQKIFFHLVSALVVFREAKLYCKFLSRFSSQQHVRNHVFIVYDQQTQTFRFVIRPPSFEEGHGEPLDDMHLFGQVLQNISRRGTLSQERENFLELLTQRDGQAAALIPNRDILREPFFRTLYSTVLGMPLEEYRQIILIEEQTLIYCPRASFDLTQQEMSALLAPLPNIAQTHRLLHLQLTREPIPRVPNRFTGRGRRQPQFAMACPICHIVLTEDLARHHLQMHRYVDNERLGHLVSKCPFCNVQKMPNAQLVNHWLYQCKFKHPNAKHTKCPFCRFENTGSNVMEHINTEHRDLIPHFREITTQNRPPMRRKPAKIRMCLDCYALVSDIDWKDHVKHKHIEQITNCYPDLEETVQCPLCDQRPNKLDVITHLLTDCPRNHFRTTVHRKCPFCNVSCSPNVIWAHIRVRHKALFDWSWEFVKADLSCPQCRKSRTPDKLVKHVIHHHKKNTVRSNTHDSHLCPQCLDIVPKELYFDHLVVHRRERRRYRHT